MVVLFYGTLKTYFVHHTRLCFLMTYKGNRCIIPSIFIQRELLYIHYLVCAYLSALAGESPAVYKM